MKHKFAALVAIILCAGTLAHSDPDSNTRLQSRWLIKSSAYTAKTGDKVAVDLTSATVSITVPAAPILGDNVFLLDAQGQAATHTLTVIRGSNLIAGVASNLTISTNNAATELVWVAGATGWQVIRFQ